MSHLPLSLPGSVTSLPGSITSLPGWSHMKSCPHLSVSGWSRWTNRQKAWSSGNSQAHCCLVAFSVAGCWWGCLLNPWPVSSPAQSAAECPLAVPSAPLCQPAYYINTEIIMCMSTYTCKHRTDHVYVNLHM